MPVAVFVSLLNTSSKTIQRLEKYISLSNGRYILYATVSKLLFITTEVNNQRKNRHLSR